MLIFSFYKGRLSNKMQSTKKEWESTNKGKYTDLEWLKT
jgi:hypothetical protein